MLADSESIEQKLREMAVFLSPEQLQQYAERQSEVDAVLK